MSRVSSHFKITLSLIFVLFFLALVFLAISSEKISSVDAYEINQPVKTTLNANAIKGYVLPFTIILAIRNYGFPQDILPAQVAVSVDGGTPADWMATGIYIAEHSIRNRAVAANVEVYVKNPWGDMPPTRNKQLANIFYSPDPKHSPWGEGDSWTIMPAAKAGTMADIEFDKLSADLISDDISDPEKQLAVAVAQARRITIKKYGLRPDWRVGKGLGLTGEVFRRDQVDVLAGTDVDNSLNSLIQCLSSNDGVDIYKGCYPSKLRFQSH